MLQLHRLAVLHHIHGRFDDVLQLPDIAPPAAVHEEGCHLRRHARYLFAHFCAVFLHKCRRQKGDIVQSPPQGRDLDADGIEPVQNILPHLAAGHHLADRPVGGCDDAYIQRDWLGGSQRCHRLLLQHPQQLRLKQQRHGVDLIEIDGAAVGLGKHPLFVLRPGKRPLLGTEQQSLQNTLRQGGTVHRHKGLILAAAGIVQRRDDELLSRARLAVHQHRGAAVRHLGNGALDLQHLAVLGDDILQRPLGLGAGAALGRRPGRRSRPLPLIVGHIP